MASSCPLRTSTHLFHSAGTHFLRSSLPHRYLKAEWLCLGPSSSLHDLLIGKVQEQLSTGGQANLCQLSSSSHWTVPPLASKKARDQPTEFEARAPADFDSSRLIDQRSQSKDQKLPRRSTIPQDWVAEVWVCLARLVPL